MQNKSLMSQLLTTASATPKLDEVCKKLVSHKIILAWIMKYSMEEYANYSVTDIAKYFIVDEAILFSQAPVHKDKISSSKTKPNDTDALDKLVMSVNTEDSSITEGSVTFDLLFRAILPTTKEPIGMFINIEAQDNFYPGYPLVKRGIYYCCRMISSQYGTIFTGSHYEKIQKVYSIWICTTPPKRRQNTITKYEITKKELLGRVKEPLKNYDLLSVVIIGLKTALPVETDGQSIIDLLSTLLSTALSPKEKELILEKQYNISMTHEMKEDIEKMCNISRSIKTEGIELGYELGIKQGRNESMLLAVKNLMQSLKLSSEEAMDALCIPQADRIHYLKSI